MISMERQIRFTNWAAASKGGILAFVLHFLLVLLLDGTSVITLSLMNFGSVFVGGMYAGKRAPFQEMYHGMLAGLVKGVLDQLLMVLMGSAPSAIAVMAVAAVGLLGGLSARYVYRTRRGRRPQAGRQ